VQDPGCNLPPGSANQTIQDLLTRVRKLLNDIPMPGEDDPSINIGHIGDLQEILDRLSMLIASLGERNSLSPDG
jgi:hypothetical protein